MREVFLLGALIFAATAPVHARGGGGDDYSSDSSGSSSYSSGDSYSSGSSDSSSSGSSGSSGSDKPLTSGETAVMLAACVAAAVILFYGVRMEKGLNARRDAKRAASTGLPAFQELDRRFREDAFLPRAEAAFLRVQEAWSAGDMTSAAALLSDGVFERFQLLLELQRREGRLNKLEDVDVVRASVARAAAGTTFDAIDVRIVASCRDTYVSARDGSLLKESESSFAEYWSFLRAVSARGRDKPGAAEGVCPSCGAALAVNASAVCPQCKCWVNSGEFDWVLAEITQESEWQAGASAAAQELEDRASMLFWRWLRCLADKDAEALAGWCSPEGLAALMASGVGRVHYEHCGVGSVTLGAPADRHGLEAVTAEIRWAGRERGLQGLSRKHLTLLTLARAPGTQTPLKAALRSAHCSACGAAIAPAASTCAHCGTGFKDPAAGWVLVNIHTRPMSSS
ncbi:MAG: hypothetical protein FD126_656 [Elusimicrobia bacterium]|nr:MAG: hypothetical protein FD126_656 [Elusimicrobiota bacterium]